ncbi:hypothetical protein GP486_002905 [Trichoglossum hirsutum]|uniref:Uncharacterized protein n=1 Tax=Trichoglossum hirsutum TaxID=265104 RepID=A0A9P8LE29_9PEZI|nr:hypothetical protein GP486_002905 [Trichoglossum hirsutum]
MLSRAASGASSRLRRARSSASVGGSQQGSSKPECIDPETARQHAVAAASYAFQRASERGSVVAVGVSSGSNDLPERSNSTANAHLGRERTLSRQRSVKFAGRAATERRQFTKNRDRIGVARTKSGSVSSVHRQPRNGVSLQRQESITASLYPYDEYYMPEDDIASTPSSYRRLRKAKSMVSPRAHAYAYGTPESGYNRGMRNTGSPAAASENQPTLGEAILRAPRSMSFLRGGREYVPRSPRKNHDAAVQMARRQYLEQLEKQRLKARQSFVLSSAARRQQKAFRKTVRTTSQTSYGSAISSSDQQIRPARGGKFSSKARNLSLTIKETFKRVFHRSSENRDSVPIQQVDATRQHFREYVPSDVDIGEGYGDILVPQEGTLSHVPSRMPSVQVVPSDIQLRPQAGSIRSVRSEGDQNDTLSCIGSSNNSTAVNSWATRQAAERKRLSIIRESGGTQWPSSSSIDGTSGYKALRGPARTSDGAPSPVDSQRVYSALMKRLDKSRLGTRQEEENYMRTAHDYADPTVATVARGTDPISAQRTPTTIRHIVEESDDERNESRVGVRISKSVIFSPLPERQADDVFSPVNATKAPRAPRNRHTSRSSREDPASRRPSLSHLQVVDSLMDGNTLTPQQVANHNEKMRLNRGHVLREARSTFFPNLSGPRITTPSPYKRVLGGVGSESERTAVDLTASAHILQKLRKISENSVPQRQGSVTGCSSVYSRTTSGSTPKPEDNAMFLSHREPSDTGTAIIITDHAFRGGTGPTRKSTNTLSRSSNEWKTWMSSEILSLDRQNTGRAREGGDLKATMGHQREGAQIDGDDTQVGHGGGSLSPHTSQILPLSTVHGNVVVKQASRYKIPSEMVFPLMDTGSQSESVQSTLASQQHCYRVVRPVSSTSSLRSTRTCGTNSSMGRLNSAARRDDRLKARSAVDMRSRCNPAMRVRGVTTADSNISKGAAMDADGQFGLLVGIGHRHRSSSSSRDENNHSPVGGGGEEGGYDRVNEAGFVGPTTTTTTTTRFGVMGGQRMVDLFLSSRRKRIRGSDGSGINAFL